LVSSGKVIAHVDYDIHTIAAICGAQRLALDQPTVKISSITTSSQEATAGSLFVPLVDKRDGHMFIQDALHRGAVAFLMKHRHVIEQKLTPEQRRKAIVVADPLIALGQIAAFHRRRFVPLVIAVTGSNGKTTTKEMLTAIFRGAVGNACVATEKNYNNHIGVPFTLLRIDKSTRVAIIEMGMNHAGEIAYLSNMAKPDHAVISSIGHAHIEFLGSRKNIARAKAEVVLGMPATGNLYIPRDIAEVRTIISAATRHKNKIIQVDVHRGAAMRLHQALSNGFELRIGKESLFFPHVGESWVSNLALAVRVAADAGIKSATIAAGIKKFRPAVGRMQVHKGHYTVIDDGYNANPDSAVASIQAAMQVAAARRVVCIFGDFKELGKFSRELHERTGETAALLGVSLFLGIGVEMKHAVRGFLKKAKASQSAFSVPRSFEAIAGYLQNEPRGTVILVKGSRAMKMEEIAAQLQKMRNRSGR
jgi:UDP-N-acetylmuramoyl-tripeptide--D-alanyl-D-alanine ligase